MLARHLLADERAGRVMTATLTDDQFLPVQGRYASTWRADPRRAGRGALLEHSIHDVDVLTWLLGPVTAVSAVARERHGLDRIDDATVGWLEFTSGALGTLTTVWHDQLERPNMRRLEVLCERLHMTRGGRLRRRRAVAIRRRRAQPADGPRPRRRRASPPAERRPARWSPSAPGTRSTR